MTTYPTSTIQQYTDNLVDNLKKRSGLKDTFIGDGPPPLDAMQLKEWIVLGDVNGGQKWAVVDAQRRPRDEEYTIDVLISVVSATVPGDDKLQSALNNRCMALFAELEQELRGNPTQGVGQPTGFYNGGFVIVSEIANPNVKLQKRGNDTAREAAMEFGITVKARL
jgi:hypothetical protein